MCNQKTKPDFTAEQIAECQVCKHASGKKIWCCLFGAWISKDRIIQPSKRIVIPNIKTKHSCCRKKTKNIIKGYYRYVLGKKYKFADDRIRICQKCDKNYWIGRTLWCSMCKCFVPAKARVENETCPLTKWLFNKKM